MYNLVFPAGVSEFCQIFVIIRNSFIACSACIRYASRTVSTFHRQEYFARDFSQIALLSELAIRIKEKMRNRKDA